MGLNKDTTVSTGINVTAAAQTIGTLNRALATADQAYEGNVIVSSVANTADTTFTLTIEANGSVYGTIEKVVLAATTEFQTPFAGIFAQGTSSVVLKLQSDGDDIAINVTVTLYETPGSYAVELIETRKEKPIYSGVVQTDNGSGLFTLDSPIPALVQAGRQIQIGAAQYTIVSYTGNNVQIQPPYPALDVHVDDAAVILAGSPAPVGAYAADGTVAANATALAGLDTDLALVASDAEIAALASGEVATKLPADALAKFNTLPIVGTVPTTADLLTTADIEDSDQLLTAFKADVVFAGLFTDADAAKTASQSVDGKLTTARADKLTNVAQTSDIPDSFDPTPRYTATTLANCTTTLLKLDQPTDAGLLGLAIVVDGVTRTVSEVTSISELTVTPALASAPAEGVAVSVAAGQAAEVVTLANATGLNVTKVDEESVTKAELTAGGGGGSIKPAVVSKIAKDNIITLGTRQGRTTSDRPRLYVIPGETHRYLVRMGAQGSDGDSVDDFVIPTTSDVNVAAVVANDAGEDGHNWGIAKEGVVFTLAIPLAASVGSEATVGLVITPEAGESRRPSFVVEVVSGSEGA